MPHRHQRQVSSQFLGSFSWIIDVVLLVCISCDMKLVRLDGGGSLARITTWHELKDRPLVCPRLRSLCSEIVGRLVSKGLRRPNERKN